MSVVYRIFFTFLLVSISAPSAAQPETERHYRVELIVVRHLAGSSDSTPQQQLRDLSEILDLYAPVDGSADALQPKAPPVTDADNPDVSGLEPEDPLAVRVDEMSDTMRESWRRLRGSAGFRPELFRAWEQSGDEPFPTLRIHDDELLFEIEPGALLDGLPVDEHGALVFSDQTLQRQQDSEAPSRKSGSPGEAETIEEPQTQYFYRIDGTARLTRGRFLHLGLDIEFREPLYGDLELESERYPDGSTDPLDTTVVDSGEVRGSALEADAAMDRKTGPAAAATAFRIHNITQRRQVKTEQMEYFDGPVIGVLALVTGFDVVVTEDMNNTDNTDNTESTESIPNAGPTE